MQLKELLQRLCEGEFDGLAVGHQVDGGPLDQHYAKLVRHIDLGLLELHKRFPLKIREAFIQQYDHIQNYKLNERYAATNKDSKESTKYICDSRFNKFTNSSFLRIDTLFNELGAPVVMDDMGQQYSMFISGHDTIQVPYPDSANNFVVHYKAGHPLLPTDRIEDVEVDIPYTHLEPLLFYVASRVLIKVDPEGAQGYMMRFENSCMQITQLNLAYTMNTPPEQFARGGWI